MCGSNLPMNLSFCGFSVQYKPFGFGLRSYIYVDHDATLDLFSRNVRINKRRRERVKLLHQLFIPNEANERLILLR